MAPRVDFCAGKMGMHLTVIQVAKRSAFPTSRYEPRKLKYTMITGTMMCNQANKAPISQSFFSLADQQNLCFVGF